MKGDIKRREVFPQGMASHIIIADRRSDNILHKMLDLILAFGSQLMLITWSAPQMIGLPLIDIISFHSFLLDQHVAIDATGTCSVGYRDIACDVLLDSMGLQEADKWIFFFPMCEYLCLGSRWGSENGLSS